VRNESDILKRTEASIKAGSKKKNRIPIREETQTRLSEEKEKYKSGSAGGEKNLDGENVLPAEKI